MPIDPRFLSQLNRIIEPPDAVPAEPQALKDYLRRFWRWASEDYRETHVALNSIAVSPAAGGLAGKSYVTANSEAALTDERVLTAISPITRLDNGPNSTIDIGITTSGLNPQPLGTVAPGVTGEVSDAGHIHPIGDLVIGPATSVVDSIPTFSNGTGDIQDPDIAYLKTTGTQGFYVVGHFGAGLQATGVPTSIFDVRENFTDSPSTGTIFNLVRTMDGTQTTPLFGGQINLNFVAGYDSAVSNTLQALDLSYTSSGVIATTAAPSPTGMRITINPQFSTTTPSSNCYGIELNQISTDSDNGGVHTGAADTAGIYLTNIGTTFSPTVAGIKIGSVSGSTQIAGIDIGIINATTTIPCYGVKVNLASAATTGKWAGSFNGKVHVCGVQRLGIGQLQGTLSTNYFAAKTSAGQNIILGLNTSTTSVFEFENSGVNDGANLWMRDRGVAAARYVKQTFNSSGGGLTADRTFTIDMTNGDRTFVPAYVTQSVTPSSTPTFVGLVTNAGNIVTSSDGNASLGQSGQGFSALWLKDTGAAFDIQLQAASLGGANRTLTLSPQGNYTITVNGSPTLNDWFDQGVKQASSVQFSDVTTTAALNAIMMNSSGGGSVRLQASGSATVNAAITLHHGDAARTFTINGNATVNQDTQTTASPTFAGLNISDAGNIVLGTTTGTKIGTATTQKIGLWNATPVVQHSSTGETSGFTAGSGTGVNDDSTFTGNTGATAYRISDVVKALKNAGLMAM